MLDIAGQLCKILLPIEEDVFLGNSKSNVAICTLSSMDLLREISNSNLMEKILLVGRLLSENKGIDSLIRYVNDHPDLHTIIICGKDVTGHKAGHALICLHKFGIDDEDRIINSVSPSPVLCSSKMEIQKFRDQIILIDKIGQTDLKKIREFV